MSGSGSGSGGQAGRAWAIARVNMARLRGDRRAAFAGLVLPILIMILVGVVFGGGANRLGVGVVDLDHSALSARAVSLFERSSNLHIRHYSTNAKAAGALRRGLVLGGLGLPAGYGAAVEDGRRPSVFVLYNAGQVQSEEARADLVGVLAQVDAEVSAARFAEARTGLSFHAAMGRAEAIDDSAYRASLRRPAPAKLSPFAYTAPSNLVLFTFIMAMAVSAGFVQSRRLGVVRRMLSTPTSPLAVIGGESAGILGVALGQGVFLLLVGALVLRVHWGDPLAVALVIIVQSLAAAGGGLLVGTLARTPEQALAIAIPTGIAFGMLGGCMWSLDIVGPTMRAVGHIVPQAWSMDAFIALTLHHGGLGSVAVDLAALAGYAVVLGGAGALMLRRSVAADR
ncbi:MAG TPA: ABC transporter permease [Acidimicrobiales bacterium]|nr:ABC transporter permease [Acidimicrobiales bacterium]